MKKTITRAQEYTYHESHTPIDRAFAKSRERYLKKILEEIKPDKILDLGCGEGSFANMCKNITNSQAYGLDISESGVKLAREKGIIAKKADLNKGIPFPDEYFNLIISDQFLEHIYNTDLLLEECYRVLKKDGYIITITPNLSYWMNRIVFLFGMYPIFSEVSTTDKTLGQGFLKKLMREKEAMGHIRVFNLPALVDILEAKRFQVLDKIGIPLSFNLPKILKIPYDLVDTVFAMKPSLARDLMVIAKKQAT